MVSRLFLVYVIAELAVVVALASTIGLGWTLLLLLVAFAAGLVVEEPDVLDRMVRVVTSLARVRSATSAYR